MEESQQPSEKMSYLKSSGGILKILEFITLLLAWFSFFVFKDQISPENYKNWKELFFLIVHFTGCLAMFLFFLVFVTRLEKKLGTSRCWHLFQFIFQLCLALCCVVISAQWAKWAQDNLDYHKTLSSLYTLWIFLVTAIVSSFTTCLLLAVDNIFICTYRI